MNPERRTIQIGRLLLSVPVHTELRELTATVNGVELEELDLGDNSAEAAYLGWFQASEQAREDHDFDEVEVDDQCWVAQYGSSHHRVIALQARQGRGLVLAASTAKHKDAVARVHDLRQRYTSSPQNPLAGFGLRFGLLDLPPSTPEELTVSLECGDGWSLSVGTCAVSLPSPSAYEGLATALRSSPDPAARPHVEFMKRDRGSLAGEELFMEILGESVPVYQAIWRDPGRVRDPGHPEIEVEFSIRGLPLETARSEWWRIIESLRLASEGGVA